MLIHSSTHSFFKGIDRQERERESLWAQKNCHSYFGHTCSVPIDGYQTVVLFSGSIFYAALNYTFDC